jgi:polyhydroxybutyrate depolymerase
MMNLHRLVIMTVFMLNLALMNNSCGSMPSSTLSPTSKTITGHIKAGGKTRSYRLYLPGNNRGDDGGSLPMILVLHGAFSSARQIEKISGFSEIAERERFVVVYPNGIGLFGWLRHWNAGFCCGRAMRAAWDDTGFLLRLIEVLTQQFLIDEQRIYMVGMSNGGMLAHRFALEHPEKLAAVTLAASAVGARWKDQAEMPTVVPPAQSMPVLIMHARDDDTIPFEGGRGKTRSDVGYLGPRHAAHFWCESNGCVPSPTAHYRVPGAEWMRWSSCLEGAEVAMLICDQGGHNWTRRQSDPPLAEPPPDWAEAAWQFMSRFKRP